MNGRFRPKADIPRSSLPPPRPDTRLFWLEAPSSATDTFEIARGVINYVGDWKIRVDLHHRRRL